MQCENFREWLMLQEGQWISADHIRTLQDVNRKSLLNKSGTISFFEFDGMPVTDIDFRFERLGLNRLNNTAEGKGRLGSRWIAQLPNSIKFANGQVHRIQPTEGFGSYIVVNATPTMYRLMDSPYVSLSSRPTIEAKAQLEKELWKKMSDASRGQHLDMEEAKRQVQEKLDSIKNVTDEWYTVLPRNWLEFAVITVNKVQSKRQEIPCPKCKGSGQGADAMSKKFEDECDQCAGKGRIDDPNAQQFVSQQSFDLLELTRKGAAAAAVA